MLKVSFKFGAAALNVTHFKYYLRDILSFLPEWQMLIGLHEMTFVDKVKLNGAASFLQDLML